MGISAPSGEWNAAVEVQAAFFDPCTRESDIPDVVRVTATAWDESWSSSVDIATEELTTARLEREFCRLRFSGKRKTNLGADLKEQLFADLARGRMKRGYCFSRLGAVTLPNGKLVFVRGNEAIGEIGCDYILRNEAARYHLKNGGVSIADYATLLTTVQFPALLVLAFALLACIRSILVEAGATLQAVLFLEGRQGRGKTTVATRVGGVYVSEETNRTAGVIQLGSTFASIRDALLTFRDAAVVIDDLCISASSAMQRGGLDTAAKIMRLASGDIPITRKSGRTTVEAYASAMAIMTAEFCFDNMSDLTRCILVPVREQLALPDALTPEASGRVLRHFSAWVTEHRDEVVSMVIDAGQNNVVSDLFDKRIRVNYGMLRAVWDMFLLSLKSLDIDAGIIDILHGRFSKALEDALREHAALIKKLREHDKRGNLAWIIQGALETKALNPGKKVLKDDDERADRYRDRGCLWLKNKDLGADAEVLLQLVRAQPGYHDATRNSMVRELKDIGALVLNRNGKNSTSQVKLWNGGSWGYRIRLDVLEDVAEAYE